MSIKITILLVIGFSALITNNNINAQALDARFIVYIAHFPAPFLNETVNKCVGTLISQLHILSTASCVTVQSPTEIAVNMTFDDGNASGSVSVPADRVIIHPFYESSEYSINNAALVITTMFRSNPHFGFVPRQLGGFSSPTIPCNLFGWGGELIDPRRDSVSINVPADCNINYPQNYCSVFDSVYDPTCSALNGSPLTCGNDMAIAGFVTSEAGCSTFNTVQTRLHYHSVSDFRDWIEGVIGPELPDRDDVNFIVTVEERDIFAVPRCFGTIISSNRILTTATCATIESTLELEVQQRIVQGSQSRSVNFRAARVYIHPYYRQENPFQNNVAIVEIHGTFDERIVPRTLGSFQQSNVCQLYGWGPSSIGFTRYDSVTMNRPQECNATHPQAYCTSHPTIFHYSYNAMTGSLVTCGNNEAVIAGFLINNGTCSSNDNRASLSYHSVSDFSEWILNPTNDGVPTTKMSTVFVLFAVLISVVAL